MAKRNDVDERIVSQTELSERLTLNRATIWRMVREGRFPPPVQLTSSRIGWRWSVVLDWLEQREAHPERRRVFFGHPSQPPVKAGRRRAS
jgi:prophage regulatory protein